MYQARGMRESFSLCGDFWVGMVHSPQCNMEGLSQCDHIPFEKVVVCALMISPSPRAINLGLVTNSAVMF